MVEEAISDQINTNAHTRAVAILERHGEIPLYSELKKGISPDAHAADGPYAPSEADSQPHPKKRKV
jgi:hypothetical protein